MKSEELRRTPLFDAHQKLGGKLVPFAGWELPVQYSGVIAEHNAVRTQAGLFDVSHMGEVFVTGPEAEVALDWLTCNSVKKLTDGKAQYSALLNERGGVIDDVIIYRFSAERYLVCVNASNAEKDFEWMLSRNKHQAKIENHSSAWGQIALQGPRAVEIADALPFSRKIGDTPYFGFAEVEFLGSPVIAARTGYTGEDGFEFFVPSETTVALWEKILAAGQAHGLMPAGLGARDSLRLEACYPLHGHELGEDINALESGLGWIVKFEKGDFIGRTALWEVKERGVARALVGFVVADAGIARQGDRVFLGDGQVGIVTSGTKTPTLNQALGLALVETKAAPVGTELLIEVRGKKLKASVVKKPFYKRTEK